LERLCVAHTHVIPAESFTLIGTDEGRVRAIAMLQHKAKALETMMEERTTILSEQKRLERSVSAMTHQLHEAVAARDAFSSVAAHELKTPITGLRAYVQLLLKDVQHDREIPPPRLASALLAIELQTSKLSRLVARLLDSAQIDAGKLRIDPKNTDLVQLVQSALAQHSGGPDHTVLFDSPGSLEAEVDAIRFEQVVSHLLDNAIKYSPHGGSVIVGLSQTDPGGIELSVTDQGVGIPPDQRSHVFDRFHQAHGERHLSGLGLGLYVAREIVELHGGSVRIEEPEHAGSRFVVSLPTLVNRELIEPVPQIPQP
jgi:signal transduction histidine kinase